MITHEQLMRYLDGELPMEEARAVEAAMEQSTELRREYILFSRLKSDLQALGGEMPHTTTVWTPVRRAITRPLGWILFIVGTATWLGYGIYSYLVSPEAMWEKLATGAVVIGLAMLLLSALLDRLRDLKTDPYREIRQ